MANVKVEIDTAFNNIRTKLNRYQSAVIKETAKVVKQGVIESISKGKSPVRGQGNYKTYSDSYKDAIRKGKGLLSGKSVSPVNLSVTGKMLKSIKVRLRSNGFTLWFSSPIAKYHNELGAGKKRVIRRMLPMNGESFNLEINTKIRLLLKSVRFRIFK